MGERWFSDKELAAMSPPTMDLAIEKFDAQGLERRAAATDGSGDGD